MEKRITVDGRAGRITVEQARIEATLGVCIRRGWVLDGTGPARFGWVAIYPACERYLARTLAEVDAQHEAQP
jgi:hypothetical protein